MNIIDDLTAAARQPPHNHLSSCVLVPRGMLVKAAERITELEATLIKEKPDD